MQKTAEKNADVSGSLHDTEQKCTTCFTANLRATMSDAALPLPPHSRMRLTLYCWAPEADIFCFAFLPVQKPFRFKCDFVYGQIISSGEHWTAAETAALEAAVNRIAEKMFQTAG